MVWDCGDGALIDAKPSRAGVAGRPAASDTVFFKDLERRSGRLLNPARRGPKPKRDYAL